MTTERKNNLMHNIQTSMIGLIFLGVATLVKLEFDNAKLMTTILIKQQQDEVNISTLQQQYNLLNSTDNNHETRISILENKK